MGWYKEMIMQGAFDEVLGDDVRALVNHEDELVLARTKSKTLELWLDEKGNLKYRFKVPNRSYALDLYDAIVAGDVDQSSFAFTVKEESWVNGQGGEPDLRKIIKFEKLYDVSPVTFPAYEDTTVAKRNHETIEKPIVEEGVNENELTNLTDGEQLDLEVKIKLNDL
jgi:HK97 family phage prohead protease